MAETVNTKPMLAYWNIRGVCLTRTKPLQFNIFELSMSVETDYYCNM